MKENATAKLLLQLIGIGFILNFVFNGISFMYPPDMSHNPPIYSHYSLLWQSLGTAFIIFSSTLLGMKLADERKLIPAAGFTMMAIAHALQIVVFYEYRNFTLEENQKIYDIASGFVALMLPASFLLLFYDEIPKWTRGVPLLYTIQQGAIILIYFSGYQKFNVLDQSAFIGYNVWNLVLLYWGILCLIKAKKVPGNTSHDTGIPG